MAVLRCGRADSTRGIQLPHQNVDDRPRMQQLGMGSKESDSSALPDCRRRVLCDGQVGPCGWNQRTGSIRQHQRQMKLAASMAPTEYIERRSLKRMARSNDGYLFGIPIKMVAVVVGSLSSGPSTGFIINVCWIV
jgi:hypothetical protein